MLLKKKKKKNEFLYVLQIFVFEKICFTDLVYRSIEFVLKIVEIYQSIICTPMRICSYSYIYQQFSIVFGSVYFLHLLVLNICLYNIYTPKFLFICVILFIYLTVNQISFYNLSQQIRIGIQLYKICMK